MPDSKLTSQEKLAAQVFLILNICFILFIMSASWTGGEFNGLLEIHFAAVRRWNRLFSYTNLRDTVTNILLYIPLGVLTALSVGKSLRLFSGWLLFGFLISFSMESVQSLIGRSADPLDLVTNTFGYVTGFCITIIALRFLGLNPVALIGLTPDNQPKSQINTISALRFMYTAIYVIASIIPFDLCVRMTHIYGKFHPDTFGKVRIILDPLYHFKSWPTHAFELLFNFMGLLPIAILTALLDGLKRRFHPANAIAAAFFTAFFLEIAQIFFYSKTTDVITIFVAFFTGWVGWGLMFLWFKLQDFYSLSPARNKETGFKWLRIFLSVYLIFVCLFAWYPFVFEERLDEIIWKIKTQTNLIPFLGHFRLHNIYSAVDLVKELGIFIPLGILISFYLQAHMSVKSRWKILYAAFAVSFAVGLFIEMTQIICKDRGFDATDVVLNALGGFLGAILLKLFRKSSVV